MFCLLFVCQKQKCPWQIPVSLSRTKAFASRCHLDSRPTRACPLSDTNISLPITQAGVVKYWEPCSVPHALSGPFITRFLTRLSAPRALCVVLRDLISASTVYFLHYITMAFPCQGLFEKFCPPSFHYDAYKELDKKIMILYNSFVGSPYLWSNSKNGRLNYENHKRHKIYWRQWS